MELEFHIRSSRKDTAIYREYPVVLSIKLVYIPCVDSETSVDFKMTVLIIFRRLFGFFLDLV